MPFPVDGEGAAGVLVAPDGALVLADGFDSGQVRIVSDGPICSQATSLDWVAETPAGTAVEFEARDPGGEWGSVASVPDEEPPAPMDHGETVEVRVSLSADAEATGPRVLLLCVEHWGHCD